MKSILRVDASDRARRFNAAFRAGGLGWLAVISLGLTAAGWISLIISLNGDVAVGAWISVVWIAGWSFVMSWALVVRNDIERATVPLRLGVQVVHLAHQAYWRLSPDTRISYGLPLVKSLYRLSVIDVQGSRGRDRVLGHMHTRLAALRGLVDAEDQQRLYAADPELGDHDDVRAAEAFQQAVEQAQQQLRSADALL